ncbi:hypothetical protein ACVWXN_002099 [Bradyrhizobium sp. i1.4.4]
MLNCGDLVEFLKSFGLVSKLGFKVGDPVCHNPHKELMPEFKAAREVGFGSIAPACPDVMTSGLTG